MSETGDEGSREKFGTPESSGGEVADRGGASSGGKRGRKRRDPFQGVDPVHSSEAGLHGRDMVSRSAFKQIKRAGVRHQGQKVVTDDVKKLKSLEVVPGIPEEELYNYYVEPVKIEYYIPKESRFSIETRNLYIPLIDPVPGPQHKLLADHIRQNRFLDLVNIMDEHPRYITQVLESYNNSMDLFESLSRAVRDAALEDPDEYRKAFYICEVLAEYEPTIATLEFLGEFVAWNMNWLIRMMNRQGIRFSASDKTVSYFIKLRNIYYEEKGLPYDERFEILAALFYEQAFPNRGMEIQDEDFFYDIFEKKGPF